MSGNRKRLLALLLGAILSAFIGLAWGVALRLLGEPVVGCVKDGAAAGSGAMVLAVAVIMLFPVREDLSTPSAPTRSKEPAA